MAIVRILKTSNSFPAVRYNEKRVSRGEAELIKTANFEEFASFIGYDEYLKRWGSNNGRIKNKQFHVTISLEKDEMSKEELTELAEKWLKEMGYGDNPYLIYYHHNTEHPHIHIITSRLDKQGNKIDDSYENERAVRILRRLEMNPQLLTNRKKISELLRYSYSTKYQFMELCTRNGFRVQNAKDGLICKKGGEVVEISSSLLEFCSERYRRNIDLKDRKKLQSLIYKYAAMLPKDKFIPFMKEKFGLEFIFYGKQQDINGYTIIDYKHKSVYKGSEVFGAKKISELFDLPKNHSDYDFIIQDILDDHPYCDYDEFGDILKNKYYYELNGNIVKDSATKQTFELNENILQKLEYNRTVKMWAETFKPYNSDLVKIVANMVHVKPSDMRRISNYEKPNSEIIDHFNKLLRDGLNSDMNLRDFLNLNHVCLIVSDNKFYLIDYITRVSLSSDDLNIKYNEIVDKLHQEVENNTRYIPDDDDDENSLENIFESVVSVVDFTGLFFTGSVGGVKNNKKRRKGSS